MTVSATARLIPRPPARVDSRNTNACDSLAVGRHTHTHTASSQICYSSIQYLTTQDQFGRSMQREQKKEKKKNSKYMKMKRTKTKRT